MSWMTNAWGVRDRAALDELGAALNVDLPELLADVADLLRSSWPDWAQCLDENQPSVSEVAVPFMHRLLETARRELANLEPAPLEAEPALQLAFEQVGQLQCSQGGELTALLSAYRVGARAAWRHVSATAVRLDLPPNVFAALGDAVFVFVDQLASASAHGYVQEQSRSGAERERMRCELADLLLSNRSDTSAVRSTADRAHWKLPAEAALVLVDHTDPIAPRIIERLDPQCLPVRRPSLYGAIVPGPIGPTRKEELARTLRGVRAIVGQTVPLAAFPASAGPARLGMALRQRGLLNDDPVFVGEHLDMIIVQRDEEILAELRKQVLRPLGELSPGTRDRLTETLASWLRHMGDRMAVADELFIHPQTVRYRMVQLREHFGAELDSPRSRARMLLALEWGRDL
jgi:hypothetical protein